MNGNIQVEYLIKKICSATNMELNCVDIEDFISQNDMQGGVNVWAFLDLMNSGIVIRGVDRETITMAIEEVYGEIVGNTLKEVLHCKSRNPVCFEASLWVP